MRPSEMAAFQRLRRKGQTIHAYAQRIADLEAQVTRLQKGIRDMNFEMWDMIGEPQAADSDEQIVTRYLHPGDLDPVKGGDE